MFSEVLELDLSSVVPSVSGPKRPHDRVSVSDFKDDFQKCLIGKVRTCIPYADMELVYAADWLQRLPNFSITTV